MFEKLKKTINFLFKASDDELNDNNIKDIKYYEKEIMINPNSLSAHYNLGKKYEESGKYEKAMDKYKQVIKISNFKYGVIVIDALNALKKILRKLDSKRYKQAMADFINLIYAIISKIKIPLTSKQINEIDNLIIDITCKELDKEETRADMYSIHEIITKSKEENDKSKKRAAAKIFFDKGISHINNKNYGTAIENFEKAYKLDPDDQLIRNKLIDVYMESHVKIKSFGTATEILEEAFRLDPVNQLIRNKLISVYMERVSYLIKESNFGAAIEDSEKARELNKNNMIPHISLMYVYYFYLKENKKIEEVFTFFKEKYTQDEKNKINDFFESARALNQYHQGKFFDELIKEIGDLDNAEFSYIFEQYNKIREKFDK